jgi:hypothetical protein
MTNNSNFYHIDTEIFLANLLLYSPALSISDLRRAKKTVYKAIPNCFIDISEKSLINLSLEYPDMFLVQTDKVFRLFGFDPEMVDIIFNKGVDKEIREYFVEACLSFNP